MSLNGKRTRRKEKLVKLSMPLPFLILAAKLGDGLAKKHAAKHAGAKAVKHVSKKKHKKKRRKKKNDEEE